MTQQWAPAPVVMRPLKDSGVAYLLWFFLGGFGAHRFYLGSPGIAVVQLLLNVFGWILAVFIIGWFLLAAFWVWWIIDAFLIPNMVRRANTI